MKKTRLKIGILLMAVPLLFSGISMRPEDFAGVSSRTAFLSTGSSEPDTFVPVKENDHYALQINKKSGAVKVIDKETKFEWNSTPADYESDKIAEDSNKMALDSQLLLTYANSKTSAIQYTTSKLSSANKGGLSFSATANGIVVTYTFREGFVIPVEYELGDSSLTASILADQIQENDGNSTLCSIALLPYFGAGGVSDSGYMFVPDGSGAIINFNNNKSDIAGDVDNNFIQNGFSQYVYGRDEAISQKARTSTAEGVKMPVFGLKNADNAFCAMITSGESRGLINASVAGKNSSYNNVYSEFIYKDMDTFTVKSKSYDAQILTLFEKSPAEVDKYSVRYQFLKKENANYTGMALAYQNYLVSEKGLKKRTQSGEYPLYIQLFGGVKKKQLFLGFPISRTIPLTKYDDVAGIAEQLKESGVTDLVCRYDEWMKDTSSSPIPVDLKTEGTLGGDAGFKRMTDYLNQNGVRMYLDVNLTDIVKSRRGYSRGSDSTKSIQRSPCVLYGYNLASGRTDPNLQTSILLTPKKVVTAAQTVLGNLPKRGVTGVSLSTLGKNLYSDFTVEGAERPSAEQMYEDIFNQFDDGGKVMAESPNSYAIPYASDILSAPSESSGFLVEDYEVPFYQIVLHGYVDYSTPPVNQYGDYRDIVLKALETGSSLNFLWAARNTDKLQDTPYNSYISIDCSDWLNQAADSYRELEPILSRVSDQRIVGSEMLQQGVYETVYENGTKITVNENDYPVHFGSQTIDQQSYSVQ